MPVASSNFETGFLRDAKVWLYCQSLTSRAIARSKQVLWVLVASQATFNVY